MNLSPIEDLRGIKYVLWRDKKAIKLVDLHSLTVKKIVHCDFIHNSMKMRTILLNEGGKWVAYCNRFYRYWVGKDSENITKYEL